MFQAWGLGSILFAILSGGAYDGNAVGLAIGLGSAGVIAFFAMILSYGNSRVSIYESDDCP